ncbi:MAG TPA: hypothetical protein VF231_07935 [Candidatus Limnocylindrales bacterium]|jgi:hypothetical protein
MTAASSILAECVGCTEYVPASGLDVLGLGLLVSLVALTPLAALHRFLRGRGR